MHDNMSNIANRKGSKRRHEAFEAFLHNFIKSFSRDILANSSIYINIMLSASIISDFIFASERS